MICTPISLFLDYLFVWRLNLGLTGATLAVVISQDLVPILLFLYVMFVNPASLQCWGGFTKKA